MRWGKRSHCWRSRSTSAPAILAYIFRTSGSEWCIFFQGGLDEAILWLEKARRADPTFPPAHSFLAAAYGLNGDTARAATELAEFNEMAKGHRDNRFATITLARENGDLNTPMLHDRFERLLIAGLRKAGMPEE